MSSKNQLLLEINSRLFVRRWGASWDDVSERTLESWANLGFDWIWCMGVWETGAHGEAVARSIPGIVKECQRANPDAEHEQIISSPYAVKDYEPRADLGGRDALIRFRSRLASYGIKLMLDFVPNHLAIDHRWLKDHPECFIQGTEQALQHSPQNYFQLTEKGSSTIFAYGRDPNFDGWRDTVQLNYRCARTRELMAAELEKVALLCDGVRCDMAMLLIPVIFEKTWGAFSVPRDGTSPIDEPFWPAVIGRVRKMKRDFQFVAEAYWDLEYDLEQQGFDYTYDKRLYDRLVYHDLEGLHAHIRGISHRIGRGVKFLENHDEPRIASIMDQEQHRAASLLAFGLPGMRLIHDGQTSGFLRRIPMQLGVEPVEEPNQDIEEHYGRLLPVLRDQVLHEGKWQLLKIAPAWEHNPTWHCFFAYCWEHPEGRWVLTINYAPHDSQCFVQFPGIDFSDGPWRFEDRISGVEYVREGAELRTRGLYLDVPAWRIHAFWLEPQVDRGT